MQSGEQIQKRSGRSRWHRYAAMLLVCVLLIFASTARAQRERGELQIEVRDPQGQGTAATGELVSESNQVKREFAIGADGRYLAQQLAFGVYRLTVSGEGFAAWTDLLDVRSEVPVHVAIVLGMAAVNTKVEVTDAATLLDPSEYGRKLGGVIELMTEKNPPVGLHGRFEIGGGSFDLVSGAGEIGYSAGKNHIEASGQGFHSGRYLDPPVLDNFTNSANGNSL